VCATAADWFSIITLLFVESAFIFLCGMFSFLSRLLASPTFQSRDTRIMQLCMHLNAHIPCNLLFYNDSVISH